MVPVGTAYLIQYRQQVGAGFTRTRLCAGNYVAAGGNDGDGHFLNRGGGNKTHAFDAFK